MAGARTIRAVLVAAFILTQACGGDPAGPASVSVALTATYDPGSGSVKVTVRVDGGDAPSDVRVWRERRGIDSRGVFAILSVDPGTARTVDDPDPYSGLDYAYRAESGDILTE